MSHNQEPSQYLRDYGDFYHFTSINQREIVKNVLALGYSIRFRVYGRSMIPFVNNGDKVTISPFGDTNPQIGNIVVFENLRDRRLVIHRVIQKHVDRFEIKGDNCTQSDGIIPLSQILGKITKIEHGNKEIITGNGRTNYLIVFLSKKKIFAILDRLTRIPRRFFLFLLHKTVTFQLITRFLNSWVRFLKIEELDFLELIRKSYCISPNKLLEIPYQPSDVFNFVIRLKRHDLGYCQLSMISANSSHGILLRITSIETRYNFGWYGIEENLLIRIIDLAKSLNVEAIILSIPTEKIDQIQILKKFGFSTHLERKALPSLRIDDIRGSDAILILRKSIFKQGDAEIMNDEDY